MLRGFLGPVDNATCYAFLCNVPLPIGTDIWYFAEWVDDIAESVDISKTSYSNHSKSSLFKTCVK